MHSPRVGTNTRPFMLTHMGVSTKPSYGTPITSKAAPRCAQRPIIVELGGMERPTVDFHRALAKRAKPPIHRELGFPGAPLGATSQADAARMYKATTTSHSFYHLHISLN